MQHCADAACQCVFTHGGPLCNKHNRLKYGLFVDQSTLPAAGFGLFASREFPPHSFLCPYQGDVLDIDSDTTEEEDQYTVSTGAHLLCAHRTKALGSQANTRLALSGKSVRRGCNADYVLRNGDEVWLKATRRIREGEEIFCYYGRDYLCRLPLKASPGHT